MQRKNGEKGNLWIEDKTADDDGYEERAFYVDSLAEIEIQKVLIFYGADHTKGKNDNKNSKERCIHFLTDRLGMV